jgi:hypothetical protein
MFKSFGEGRKESPLFSEIHVQNVSADGIPSQCRCVLTQWRIIPFSLQKAALLALNRRVIMSVLIQKEIIRITRSKLTCALEMESEGICRIVEKAPLLHSWYVFVFYQQNMLL